MKTSRLILITVAAAALVGGSSGALAWWLLRPAGAGGEAPAVGGAASAASAPVVVDKRPQKYVTLEKVVVMLRRGAGETMPHYMAVDVVLKTPAGGDEERATKDQLPLLRSIAVKTLSVHTVEEAGAMTIDQLAATINTAYNDSYAREGRDKPFSEALIGKLIVE